MVTSSKVRILSSNILTSYTFSNIATFADGQLTDAIKHLATDPGTDPKVKRKLLSVLSSWNNQFKSDPSMALVAGLYKQYRPVERRSHQQSNAEMDQIFAKMSLNEKEVERKRKEKEEREAAKRKAKENKERTRQGKNKSKRVLFDFENVRIIIFLFLLPGIVRLRHLGETANFYSNSEHFSSS